MASAMALTPHSPHPFQNRGPATRASSNAPRHPYSCLESPYAKPCGEIGHRTPRSDNRPSYLAKTSTTFEKRQRVTKFLCLPTLHWLMTSASMKTQHQA
jgi:hypothetical protein